MVAEVAGGMAFIKGHIAGWAIKKGLDTGSDQLKKVLKKDIVEVAIANTLRLFPNNLSDGIETALFKWVEGAEFKSLYAGTEAGKRERTDKEIITSFIMTTGFDLEDQTEQLSEEILIGLNRNILKELLKSIDGHSIQEFRAETRHSEIINEIQSFKKEVFSVKDSSGTLPEHEKDYGVRITVAKELIEQGNVDAAEKILISIREAVRTKNPSSELMFKIFTNLAVCRQMDGDIEGTYDYIDTAYNLQPENSVAVCNKALSYLLKDDSSGAFNFTKKQALTKDNASLVSVFIRSAMQSGNNQELDDFISYNAWVNDDKECLVSLAHNAVDKEDFQSAEQILRQADELFPEEALIQVKLGNLLMLKIQEADFPPWKIPREMREIAIESESHLSKGIEILKKHPHKYLLHLAHANRAGANKFLGNYQKGIEDCNKALEIDPKDDISKQNKGLILLMIDEYQEAIKVLEEIKSQEVKYDISMALADAYIATDNFESAVTLLEPIIEDHLDEPIVLPLASVLIRAYKFSGTPDKTPPLLEALLPRWNAEPELYCLLALQENLKGNREGAISILEQAKDKLEGENQERILLELGHFYYRAQDYSKAVECYSSIVDTSRDNPLLRNYLNSLYYAMDYKEALSIAEHIRGDGPPVPSVTIFEAAIHESIDNLDRAKELLLALFEVKPDSYKYLMKMAFIELRQGNLDEVRNLVEKIPYEKIKNDPDVLIGLARLRIILKLPHYIEYAYRARRLDYKNPTVHTFYIGACVHEEQSHPDDNKGDRNGLPYFPQEVMKDSTVKLRNDSEHKIFTILDENDDLLNAEAGEIRITDEIAQKLLGHKKGDRIILKDGPIETLTYEIEEILSKYTYAFQKVLSDFSTLFPNDSSFNRLEFQEDDLTPVLKQLDERYRFVSQALQFYESNCIPLCAFAKFVGSSLIEVWHDRTTDPEARFFCFRGNKENLGVIHDNDVLVLDIISVLTLQRLDLLDEFFALPIRRIIPQSLLDELNEKITEIHEEKPRIIIGRGEQGYFNLEISPDEVKKEKELYQNLQKTLLERKKDQKLEVQPITYALEYGLEQYHNLSKMIGTSSMDSLLIAKELSAKLYSDDQLLRWLGWEVLKVNNAWIYNVLELMFKKNLIKKDSFYNALITLISSNYEHMPVDVDFLQYVLQRHQMTINSEVDNVFTKTFKTCDDDIAIDILTNLIGRVWSDKNILDRHKLWVLDLALKALSKYKRGFHIIPRFRESVKHVFGEQSKRYLIISQNITMWERHNLVKG